MDNASPHQLAAALAGGELVLHYQPIVDAESGAVRAIEALAHWRSADHEVRSAAWLSDRLGDRATLLQAFDRAVIKVALEDRAAFPLLGAARLSIAQHRRSISMDAVRAFVDSCASRDGGPIAVALREQLDTAQLAAMPALAEELADAGIEVWHDDFGSGERTLAHLIALPSTVVKLCPELAADGVASARVRRHVRSVIAMLQNLGKTVIAEGVANAASADWLTDAGTDWLQGHQVSRPGTAAEIAGWLEEHNDLAA
ncbi:MAG: EAL domain-containing protein [Chloroflexi bacterium]|nr:EAL domain-containing protein [Chloroflexota bacterium]MDA1145674.1 EAL domain-containing protein [Chloroflexota bacterium]